MQCDYGQTSRHHGYDSQDRSFSHRKDAYVDSRTKYDLRVTIQMVQHKFHHFFSISNLKVVAEPFLQGY